MMVLFWIFRLSQDDEDEDEADEEDKEGGLSKSGKELKKLLGRSNGLNDSDSEDDDDDDDVCCLMPHSSLLFLSQRVYVNTQTHCLGGADFEPNKHPMSCTWFLGN